MTSTSVNAIEEAKYELLEQDNAFELRRYAPQILVETVVEGNFKEAGNRAFGLLFNYISGANQAQSKIAMTAPVSQDASAAQGEKIAMTAPVGQDLAADGSWRVSFLVPSLYTRETVPQPTDSRVYLREVPAQEVAVVRYSGTWNESNYDSHLKSLRDWMQLRGLEPAGEPRWARYDPPFKPWFLRRNEVLVPVTLIPAEPD
ncbi:MAG TPA: heme-binding protein [Xanthomonadales bacterium]|nr:heme-binding protein [Xanthomonadales bacterium]